MASCLRVCVCVQDVAALHARDARRAKLHEEKKALKSQQLASVPAPFKAGQPDKEDHLSHKDRSLLKIAQNEMVSETRKAMANKKAGMAAQKARHDEEEAAKQAKARAAKAREAMAKHATHKEGKQLHKASISPKVDRSWGGFLPALGKSKGPEALDARCVLSDRDLLVFSFAFVRALQFGCIY